MVCSVLNNLQGLAALPELEILRYVIEIVGYFNFQYESPPFGHKKTALTFAERLDCIKTR